MTAREPLAPHRPGGRGHLDKTEVVDEMLGLRLTYHPEDDSLDVESSPEACTRVRVGGGTRPVRIPARLRGKVLLKAS